MKAAPNRMAAMIAAPLLMVCALPGNVLAGSGTGLPSVTSWGDTYAGSVSARSFSHGTYFHLDRNTSLIAERSLPATRTSRIMDASVHACSYEAGVCVIRPAR